MDAKANRIILTGFMGSGKSAVGQLLAKQAHMRFVDTDALITGMAHRTVTDIWAEGEAVFRHWEQQAIASLVGESNLVIATGGGAITLPETRGLLQMMGPIVCLEAPCDTLWQRVAHDPERPLAQSQAAFEALYQQRQTTYSAIPWRVDTQHQTPAAIASRILDQWRDTQRTVQVPLGDRSYTIHIGCGNLHTLPHLLDGPPRACLLVVDDQVPEHFFYTLTHSLHYTGWTPHVIRVPAGEDSKNFVQAQRLYDACVRANLHRNDPILALGGGMVGDLAGFVAATYQRGVPFVQIPTTLLAQIDASVGGKVAINHAAAKNLIGCFHQPRTVLCDLTTLLTLNGRQYRAALAEMVKYAIIADAGLFEEIVEQVIAIQRRDLTVLSALVARCLIIKARLVAADERETADNQRVLLNFGHTLGHALEQVSGYGVLLHGEAVAIGMHFACQLATQLGYAHASMVETLSDLLRRLELPITPPRAAVDDWLNAIQHDKKNRHDAVTFVVATSIGEATTIRLKPETLRQPLRDFAGTS
jgi:3-dehydroquinate synthase